MKFEARRGITPIVAVLIVIFVTAAAGGGAVIYNKYQSDKTAEERVNDERIAELEAKLNQLSEQQKTFPTSSPQSSTSSVVQNSINTDAIQKEIAELKKQNVQLALESKKKTTPNLPVIPPAPLPPPPPAAVPQSSPSTQLSISELAGKVKHSVVAIVTRKGTGSGFLISPTVVVTNAHVVEGIFSAGLHIDGGATTTGYTAGIDSVNDIAIIVIPQTAVAPLLFGNSDESALKQGDSVYAFGFPFGLAGEASFSSGVLSRRVTQDNTPYLEVSNSLHPGNSGGPLVDSFGKVVGMFRAIYGMGGSDGTIVGETLKFAIPGNTVKNISNTLIANIRPLPAEQKMKIDTYEGYMSRLEYTRVEMSNLLSYRDESIAKGYDGDLIQLSTFANTVVADQLIKLKSDIPIIPTQNLMMTLTDIRLKQAFVLRDLFDTDAAIIDGARKNNVLTALESDRSKLIDKFNAYDKEYDEVEKTLDKAMRGYSTF